jgi:hypothetical protein
MELLMPVDSLQKQAARVCPYPPIVRMSEEYQFNSMAIKNSKEQRERASHLAVFSARHRPRLKDFRGGEQRRR